MKKPIENIWMPIVKPYPSYYYEKETVSQMYLSEEKMMSAITYFKIFIPERICKKPLANGYKAALLV